MFSLLAISSASALVIGGFQFEIERLAQDFHQHNFTDETFYFNVLKEITVVSDCKGLLEGEDLVAYTKVSGYPTTCTPAAYLSDAKFELHESKMGVFPTGLNITYPPLTAQNQGVEFIFNCNRIIKRTVFRTVDGVYRIVWDHPTACARRAPS
ncbi:hypothetical protein BLNAU_10271 [Blattamonas nauphoetae]|uniref:Uncharacterized protein n=1 Tax=Blattamonas nauphoetae TaxID=2049346 RepID=A0ABQ9XTI2_9EUKA|nr:hypothetical protein BLNAU_10271 [Blattamonas nauphoetae]